MTALDATDGRTARAVKTRRSVVEALLELIDAGNLRPTARMIAERAGVSQRSVYVHFDDLEDLFAEASRVQINRILEGLEPVDTTLPTDAKIQAYTQLAVSTMEGTLAIRRAASLQEPFSPTLAQTLKGARLAARRGLETTFATELEPLDPETRERAVSALWAASTSYTWESLRIQTELSVEDAHAVIVDMFEALLTKYSP